MKKIALLSLFTLIIIGGKAQEVAKKTENNSSTTVKTSNIPFEIVLEFIKAVDTFDYDKVKELMEEGKSESTILDMQKLELQFTESEKQEYINKKKQYTVYSENVVKDKAKVIISNKQWGLTYLDFRLRRIDNEWKVTSYVIAQ